MRRINLLGTAAAGVLLLTACDDENAGPPPAAPRAALPATPAPAATEEAPAPAAASEPEPPPVALARWRSCGVAAGRDLECAEIDVPLDYGEPNSERLPIAIRRIRADVAEPYRGVLLFNPGGPGGEGVEAALQLFAQLNAVAPGYDIVGFDPRGVGRSGDRSCIPESAEFDPYAGLVAPVEQSELMSFLDNVEFLGDLCEEAWGPMFRKLGSNNVVRDMEEIRKALGALQLNYYGVTYGTLLGALYAHAYPQQVGRMVLDTAVPPRTEHVERTLALADQQVLFHEDLLSSCEAGLLPSCPTNARSVFDSAMSSAQQRGIELDFVQAWRGSFAVAQRYLALVDALAAEAADPGGDWIEAFSAQTAGSEDFGLVAALGVTCTDTSADPPTLEQLESLDTTLRAKSPILAGLASTAGLCTSWPATRDPVPVPTAPSAGPVLVVGGGLDADYPLSWSRSMTETLGNATLLVSQHFGTAALALGGTCVQGHLRAYLTSGSMPSAGTVCQAPAAAAPAEELPPPSAEDLDAGIVGSDAEDDAEGVAK